MADTGNNRIQAFSEDGKFIIAFGKAGSQEGQFNEPVGVAVDKTGEVFVVDRGNERIQVFTLDGEYLRTLDPRKGLDSPSGVAIGPDGLLYVSISGHQVVVLDPQSGEQLGAIGGFGAGSGEFDSPSGLSWNLNGKLLYVADTGNDRIEVYGYGKKGAKAAAGQAASDRPTGLTLPAGALPGSESPAIGPGAVVPGEEPTIPPAPGQLALQGLVASPNPFDPRSGEVLAVSFGVNMGASVKLVIRDRFGRIAYESAMQEVQAGSVLLEWNGRTIGGTYAPPGAYTVSVEAVAGGESARDSVEVTVAAKGGKGPARSGSPRERARTQGQ